MREIRESLGNAIGVGEEHIEVPSTTAFAEKVRVFARAVEAYAPAEREPAGQISPTEVRSRAP